MEKVLPPDLHHSSLLRKAIEEQMMLPGLLQSVSKPAYNS